MIPQEYIKSALKEFIINFPQTRVRYEFDSIASTHFVEIIPNSIYHLDEAYIAWESSFYELFTKEYPTQNICFISDDALVGLDEVHLELIGSSFTEYSVNKDCNYIPVEELRFNEFVSTSVITGYSVYDGLGSIIIDPLSAFSISLKHTHISDNIYSVNGCTDNNIPSFNEEYYPLAA